MSEASVLDSPAGRAYEPTVTRVKTAWVISPALQSLSDIPAFSARPRRVAAYARVSTSGEEQLASYEAQVKHYAWYQVQGNFIQLAVRGCVKRLLRV